MNFRILIFSILFLSIYSTNSYSQNMLENIVKEHLNNVLQENQKNAERVGDFSKSGSTTSTTSSQMDFFSKSDGKVNTDLDVKGIKIGMDLNEVNRILSENIGSDSASSCLQGPINENTEAILLGDYIIICKNNFPYYGTAMQHSQMIFIENKLKVAHFEYIPRTESRNDPVPKFIRDLVETKFHVEPHVVGELPNKLQNTEMNFKWVDSLGNKFIYVYRYQHDLSGYIHGPGKVVLEPADYPAYVDERRAVLANKAKQEQEIFQNKQKNDL